jgi:hypothetical protein
MLSSEINIHKKKSFVFFFSFINKPHVKITRSFTCSPSTECSEKKQNIEEKENSKQKREVCHSSQRISYVEVLIYKRKRLSTKKKERKKEREKRK